eukprot:tig00001003_g6283.t1
MDLVLSRVDYLQVSSTCRRSMRLLRAEKKRSHQVVVADDTGSIVCFGAKKGQLQTVFKTQPTGKEVNRLELGGARGDKTKIFTSSGSTIRGVTKKGKEFFKFQTNLTETINSLYVEDVNIWTAGEFVYNVFVDCNDKNYYMAGDRINDMIVDVVSGDPSNVGGYDGVLGCQDRFIRVIQGSNLFYECALDGACNALARYTPRRRVGPDGDDVDEDTPDPAAKQREVLYGTDNGLVGVVQMDAVGIKKGWKIANTKRLGAVQCVAAYDLTEDGRNDVVVGRDDGSVEVYCFDVSDEPRLVFSKNVAESVTALDVGVVQNPPYREIVLSTYGGKVLSFTAAPEPERAPELDKPLPDPKEEKKKEKEKKAAGAKGPDPKGDMAKSIQSLRGDLDKLRGQVGQARDKYLKSTQDVVAVAPAFKVNDKFVLSGEDASYTLTIEIQTPIDVVALQSEAAIDLLDMDTSVAIVSRTPPEPESGSRLLATFRCQEAVSRLEIKLRSTEGHHGPLQVYVMPRVTPKSCTLLSYSIKPLSLHQRVAELPEDALTRPMSELRLTGSFSLADAHAWVVGVLPEVPARYPAGDELSFWFRNVFLGTLLTCTYKKGEASFRSDSLSTLAILKEFVSREATAKKISVRPSFDIKEESVPHVLRLLHPRVEYQRGLALKVRLIEALKELSMHEEDTSYMTDEYKGILANAETIQRDFANQPRRLEFLNCIVADLYIDRLKFKGLDGRARLPALQKLLESYDSIDRLTAFFLEPIA